VRSAGADGIRFSGRIGSLQQQWYRLDREIYQGAAVTMTILFIAIQLNVMPGLAERIALTTFLVWEIWMSILLIRPFWTDS
jgi:hypothetical protein